MRAWYIATAALLGLTMVQALAQVPGSVLTADSLPLLNDSGGVRSADPPTGIPPADLGGGRREDLMARNTLVIDRAAPPQQARLQVALQAHRTHL